ncbi:hypothetical protein ElyMa_001439400 [Elysia marginata]|uniref:Uncharacterized protein n=1 Tax=Elysia marginata TaxID=1093978 RepID=A0AAV4IZI2_9GAST|nr:hypothetical protein ElyMa_001439400 [Elysia marginata]
MSSDRSISLGVDASTLPPVTHEQNQVLGPGNMDPFRDELDRYWKLGSNSMRTEPPPAYTPRALSSSLSSLSSSDDDEGEDDAGDWVFCPDKEEVPDADYAPHLRKRRPKKPGSTCKTVYSDTYPDNSNELNVDPPPTEFADIFLAVGVFILRLSFEILTSAN